LRDLDTRRAFDVQRMAELIDAFGTIGSDPHGGVSRLAFSPEDIRARERIKKIMADDLGLEVRIDPWGNIIGRRPGRLQDAPVLMTGSHLDSVRNGGKFDGPAGVLGGVEVVRALNLLEVETYHPVELVVFTAEEPNDFGMSTLGSRGMVGKVTREDLRERKNEKGENLLQALARIGGEPERLRDGVRRAEEILAFIEIHIEQMPYLEREGKDIGVVQGITGIDRSCLTIRGEARHGGTTPIEERRDALVAGASLITSLNSLAKNERNQAVATVGHISVYPNSVNIIPGEVVLDMEIRSFHTSSTRRIREGLLASIAEVRSRDQVDIAIENTYRTDPTTFSPKVREGISRVCQRLGYSSLDLISMAGHDANHMADITQAGMIFVPSHKGLSHCPQEWTEPTQLVKAVQVLFHTLLALDEEFKEKP
jgi:hydantoinase/carbamoylase family amidase